MKLRWAGLSVGYQWLLYVQAKLRSIDSFQNWTCKDHITKLVTWAQVSSGTQSVISPPDPQLQAGLKCLTHTRSRKSVNSNIRHSNEG